MPILPVSKVPAINEYAYSTCGTITRGQALTMSAAGFLTNTLAIYASSAPVVGVAAETKATAASLLQSNKIKVYPACDGETLWEATVSGSGSSIGIGSIVHLKNAGQGIQYSATAVTTGGAFVIDSFNSDFTLAYGRLLDGLHRGRRMPTKVGTT